VPWPRRRSRARPSAPFAAVWFARDEHTDVWSLRSRGDFDVSEVAKKYGGGHKAAAGFTATKILGG
jgi:nanoRNase/pAp phosphatase (c-di-AMP/oligoRNAs hydrolase)